MRIVMVGNFSLWNKGTMGVRALPLARALTERGHSVCLVVPPWDVPAESGHEHNIDGVRIINIRLPWRIPFLWHGLLSAALLRRALAERGDVVHIFKPKAYAGAVGLGVWLLRKLGLCHVRLIVDADDWEGTGGWNEVERFPRLIKWLIAWHERTLLRCADAVTVASRALELLAWSVGVSRDAVRYVPNGAYIEKGQRVETRGDGAVSAKLRAALAGHPIVLLYTRFLEFRLQKVVRIVKGVRQCEQDVRFLVIGKGLRGEERKLQEMLQREKLDDVVVFTGWVDKAEVPAALRLADVAIYPMDDNLLNRAKCPMKLVDLMANGVPVVAEAVGQVGEYIEDGVSGVLVSSGDEQSFIDAIVGLVRDEAARARLGENAKARIASSFDWRVLVAAVEAVYGLTERQPHAKAVAGVADS